MTKGVKVSLYEGRAVARAVSRQHPSQTARVRARSSHVGSVVNRAVLRQVLSANFGFPCQSFITPTAPKSSPSIYHSALVQ
jgi:hypothetical protein